MSTFFMIQALYFNRVIRLYVFSISKQGICTVLNIKYMNIELHVNDATFSFLWGKKLKFAQFYHQYMFCKSTLRFITIAIL